MNADGGCYRSSDIGRSRREPRHAGIGPQVDLLIFDGPPEAFDEVVVALGALAIHADLEFPPSQHLDEVCRSELAALVCIEDLERAESRRANQASTAAR